MRFEHPEILYYLWGVLILMALFFYSGRIRKARLRKFAPDDIMGAISQGTSSSTRNVKNVLLACVYIFSVISLARPQWGFEWQKVERQGLDILIAVDTSKSMLTEDVKPNRLARTKLAIKDLLRKLKGDRIGLIAFAGDAFLVCPLTVDYNGFLLTMQDLNTDTIPRGGTNLSAAIEEAIKEYDNTPSKYKAVIIVTDGENLEGDPLQAVKKAKEKGIKIYCVGIGTKEGELVQVEDANGKKEFLKDSEGNFVKSRLNEPLLQKIALTAGGVYVRASGANFGLDLIYNKELSKLEKREIDTKMAKKYFEHYQFPLGLAFFLLLIETCLSFHRRKAGHNA